MSEIPEEIRKMFPDLPIHKMDIVDGELQILASSEPLSNTLTRDEIMAMTAEQLRVAIAEKLGWEHLPFPAVPEWQRPTEHGVETYLPDYPHDIAAAWELEASVPEEERNQYYGRLFDVIKQTNKYPTGFYITHATAEQKSRAWLIWSEESGNGQ